MCSWRTSKWGTDKHGLGYEHLRELNPVLCTARSPASANLPLAPRAGYDFLVQAMGGLMSVTGERDGTPGAGPQKVGAAVTDLLTGLYMTIAALSGLRGAIGPARAATSIALSWT